MVDEAHRTQYGILGSRMSKALPNAALIGFTGTPIDNGFRRSTMRRFGSLIDSYTIPQSVADGATVPILYEARLPELAIEGSRRRWTSSSMRCSAIWQPEAVQRQLRRRYANKETVAGAAQADRDDRPRHCRALQGENPPQRLQGAGSGVEPCRRPPILPNT